MDMAISSSSSEANNDNRSFSGRNRQPGISSEKGNSSKQKQRQSNAQSSQHVNAGFSFDLLSWFPKHRSCVKFFLDNAQHDVLVQAFAAFINILLPFQRDPPLFSSRGARTAAERLEELNAVKTGSLPSQDMGTDTVSLIPYIRRLVVTGMDAPQILHGFFGNEWQQGVGPQRETERRNYLFAAKSGGWASVKKDYDMLPLETVPFLKPLTNPHDQELVAAEKTWSEWLAMEDWMVGSRAPESFSPEG